MKKFLLLDADGVVTPIATYFSKRYATDFSVPLERLLPFFQNEFRECQLGQKDLKEILPDYLRAWQWQGSVDELLKYWLLDGSIPVVEIIEAVRKVRSEGVRVYLATDQEKYRAAYLWNDLGLKNHFDGSFFSCDMGARKEDVLFWKKVLTALGNSNPAEVTFWDDEEENITAAKQAGIDAHLFTDSKDFKQSLQNL